MIEIALCIGVEHDPWLVALSVIVCSVGAYAIVQMFERTRGRSGIQRLGWAFLTSVTSGATIWCTHFVAMLAFRAGVPVILDPVLTILSLVIAVIGTFIGVGLAAWGTKNIFGTVGGAIFGLAISGMHFMGMAAYRVDGIVTWDSGYVIASLICAVVFAGAAFTVLPSDRIERYRVSLGTALIVTAIATLHFVAMTALSIEPLALSDNSLDANGLRALALATAVVGSMVIGAGVLAALIDRHTRSDAIREINHMAHNDSLTGLPNRSGFRIELTRRIEAADADMTRFGLCMIDLNRFKEINDVHGHKAGDEVLIQLARRLQETLTPNEFVARLGGDEFVALKPFTDPDQLRAFADRIDAELTAPLWVDHFEARLGASIGVAVYPSDARTSETLISSADLAMYRAKSVSSSGPCYYDGELDESIRDRRELASDLRLALKKDELKVHYQVQTNTVTGEVTGYEALLRWTHPKRGPIEPSVFIPIAEENGMIIALGEWVLRRACADAASWDHEGKVAINVSPLQLAHIDLPTLFHEVMLETGLPPRRLEIELTETAIMVDRDRALHVLRQIKALGIAVALDDFGTGYSSLQTLRDFPFDKIKLDKFFAAELEGGPRATAFIRAVLALGKSLSIPVLAEGVETREQLEILLREGCDEVQGFYLGRPGANADQQAASVDEPGPDAEPNISDAA